MSIGGNDLQLSGPGGLGLRARGSLVVLIIIIALCAIGVGYLQWRTERAIGAGFEGVIKSDQNTMDHFSRDHSRLVRSQGLLACIVSLRPEERADLRRADSTVFRRLCPWLEE